MSEPSRKEIKLADEIVKSVNRNPNQTHGIADNLLKKFGLKNTKRTLKEMQNTESNLSKPLVIAANFFHKKYKVKKQVDAEGIKKLAEKTDHKVGG